MWNDYRNSQLMSWYENIKGPTMNIMHGALNGFYFKTWVGGSLLPTRNLKTDSIFTITES
jgi:hypothetical protein